MLGTSRPPGRSATAGRRAAVAVRAAPSASARRYRRCRSRPIDRFAYEKSFLINVGDEKGRLLDAAVRRADPAAVRWNWAPTAATARCGSPGLPRPAPRSYSVELSPRPTPANAAPASGRTPGCADRVHLRASAPSATAERPSDSAGRTIIRRSDRPSSNSSSSTTTRHALSAIDLLEHRSTRGWLHARSDAWSADNVRSSRRRPSTCAVHATSEQGTELGQPVVEHKTHARSTRR